MSKTAVIVGISPRAAVDKGAANRRAPRILRALLLAGLCFPSFVAHVARADDPATSLAKLGARIERDAAGTVEAVDLSAAAGLNAGLEQAAALTSLRRLTLPPRIDDAGIAALKPLRQLEELDLRTHRDLTDAGIAHLAALPGLRRLKLPPQTTDDALRSLRPLASLEGLDVSRCRDVTDRGLAEIAALPALKSLSLAGDRGISDAGLAHLAQIPTLTNIRLRNTKVTAEGVAQLKAALPRATISN
jgi:hypothetical protein